MTEPALRPLPSRSGRLARGLLRGALLGMGVFVADILGAFAAIGFMFIPRPGGFGLLAAAAACAALVGALLGGAVGLAWPARWSAPWLTKLRLPLVLGALGVAVAAGGYGLRMERNLPPLASRPPAPAGAAPVLWIVIDTLRADALYGPDLTFPHAPNLGQLAAEGLLFTNAESSAGWTTPSMMTLLTGVHHTALGGSITTLPHWGTTIAEHLRAAGYATHAVIDNPILDPRNGFAQGLETFSFRSPYRFAFSSAWFRLLPHDLRELLRFGSYVAYAGAPSVTSRALELIAQRSEAPLFLWTHYMDPHGPYYDHRTEPPGAMPRGPDGDAFWRARDRLRDTPPGPAPSRESLDVWWKYYTDEIRWMDAHIGNLLAGWRAAYGDEGFILVTSDHGEEFYEHGHLSHGNSVFRQAVHVPLILQLPASAGISQGRTIEHPVSHHGLVPTTLDFAGVPPTPQLAPSWQPWLRGQAQPPAPVLFANQGRNGAHATRWRAGDWALVQMEYYNERPTDRFLFNLSSDPTEQHNLLSEQSERAENMLAELRSHYDTLNRQGQSQAAQAATATDLDALRALGYIQ